MQDFKKLAVWQKAHEVALSLYKATAGFPADERYGLTSQMRRAAVSAGSNIAEGCGRDGAAELSRFLQIAMGSASELEYQLLLARDLGYLNEAEYGPLADGISEASRMLYSLIQKLRTKDSEA